MASCDVKRVAETKFYLRNQCLPENFTEEIDITEYIESDVAVDYSDTTIDGLKSNSRYEEEYVTSIGLDYTFTMKLKAGTFIGQYFDVVDAEKKAGNLEVMNTFELRVVDPFDTEAFPNAYMELTQSPFHNIESKEYMVEFRLRVNGKPIIAPNVGVEALDNPQTLDLNLNAVANGLTNFDLTFDTTANSINYSNMEVRITQGLIPVTNNEIIVDGSGGNYTTINGIYDTNELATIEIYATEIGYTTQWLVGSFEYNPVANTAPVLTVNTPIQNYTVLDAKTYDDLVIDCGISATDLEDGIINVFTFENPALTPVLGTDLIPVGNNQPVLVTVTDSGLLTDSDTLDITVSP